MNRFRIKRDVYSPQEALLNWALTKRAPADPISHISAEEKEALFIDDWNEIKKLAKNKSSSQSSTGSY